MGKVIGIDGCPYGWIAIQSDGIYGVFSNISELTQYFNKSIFLIDIPMGLSDRVFKRDIDQRLRNEIPHKSSSIFTPPCREAFYSNSYTEANILNREIEQKGLSIQAWNITNKILDLDLFLQNHSNYKNNFYEAFPELGFYRFNQNRPLQHKKTEGKGIEERLSILNVYFKNTKLLYKDILRQTKRKEVKKDDLVDALCLMVMGTYGETKGRQIIQTENKIDNMGIPIRIYSISANIIN